MQSLGLGDVLVIGLGSTGADVSRILAARIGRDVDSVCVYGGLKAEEGPLTEELRGLGCDVVLGTEEIEGSFDLAVCSPGIPEHAAFRKNAAAHAAELISEPELAWRLSPDNWVAITGTNGKTTTTALARELMEAGGLVASAVGNIGDTCINAVAKRKEGEWFAAELSSFQLAACSRFHPVAAVLLNITPDHIEWHGSFEAYVAAKERMFANMDACDLAIVSIDDGPSRAIADALIGSGKRVMKLTCGPDPEGEDAAFFDGTMLHLRIAGEDIELVAADELLIKGGHNVANALAASAIAFSAGASIDGIRSGLRVFAPLEHRIEPAGTVDGVEYINDSKATNTDSTEKALTAFEPGTIVLLLGGHDKMTPLDTLAAGIRGTCKAIVCFGEAQERFLAELGCVADSGVEVLSAPHMREALELARTVAVPGDTVLLSPACSSYDEFTSYVQRGRIFKSLVADMAREAE